MKQYGILISCLLMMGLNVSISAQDLNRNSEPTQFKPVYEIVRQEGWVVPGIVTSRPVGKYVQRISRENIEIAFDVVILKAATKVHFEQSTFVYEETSKRLLEYRHDYGIDSIHQYSYRGKIFCYLVWVNEYYGGGEVVVPAQTGLMFYDTQGEGRFILQRRGGNVLEQVPDWILKLAAPHQSAIIGPKVQDNNTVLPAAASVEQYKSLRSRWLGKQ